MDTATHEDVWTTMERQLREQVPLDWRTPRDPVVLAIYSEKGGIGKSALAAGVTAVMAQNGKSVLAIDLDPRATFTHELNALKGDRSVNDLLYVDPDGDPEKEPQLAGLAAAVLRPAGEEWGKNVVVLAAERALANRVALAF
jgi:chromosome partitioning protein